MRATLHLENIGHNGSFSFSMPNQRSKVPQMSVLFCVLLGSFFSFPQQEDISLEIVSRSNNNVYFLAPHENEHVVNQYLKEKLKTQAGTFIILRQRGDRHIFLKVKGQEYEIDPNRIFSEVGIRASLLKQNPELATNEKLLRKAMKRAKKLGLFILNQMPNASAIIAIHNNTDGYDNDGKSGVGTVSMHRYQKKLDAGAKYIKKLHFGDGDEDDLFFITEPKDFESMKKANWNVLLQHEQVATIPDEDDGSLSVYSEKKGIRYINIEAQRKEGDDHLQVQMKMVDYVYDLVTGK